MKLEKKKLIIIVSCLLLVIGVSFSYFVAKTLLNGNGSETKMTTATINGATVRVEGTLEFNDTDIMPGHKIVSGIKVTATGNNELIPYNLIWNGSNNLNTQLNFTVYKTSSELAVNATCEKKTKVEGGIQYLSEECTISNEDKLGSIIGSGTINGNTTDTKVILAKDEFITATSDGSTVYYYVILEYPNLDENQNPDIGSGFNGEVTVEASNTTPDINILAVYIEQEDGTYQESQDIPQEGYTINSDKSTCTNGTIPEWDNQNKKLLLGNLKKSGTSCYLYFKELNNLQMQMLLALPSDNIFTSQPAVGEEGLYYTSDDWGTTYYFRGNVTNNWVSFAGFYWRIIRINGDGSIRLIYNGPTTDQIGETTQIGTSKYSHKDAYSTSSTDRAYVADNAYVGYMYGTAGSSTYAATHANTTSSEIKNVNDAWYKENILERNYDKYVSKEVGFCNDRQVVNMTSFTGNGIGKSTTAYAPTYRWSNKESGGIIPKFECTNANNDLFTTNISTKGNKSLTYPIGLITTDEIVFAGCYGATDNKDYYLYNKGSFWTMSPTQMSTVAYVYHVNNAGFFSIWQVNEEDGVRPVINLASDVKLTGTGTTSDPYKVVDAD